MSVMPFPQRLVGPLAVAAIILLLLICKSEKPASGAVHLAADRHRAAAVVPLAAATQDNVLVQALDYRAADDKLYGPLGYSVCPASQCWLRLEKAVDCEAAFDEYLHTLATYTPVFPAPKQLDPARKDEFLMKGFAQFKEFYFNAASWSPDAEVPVFDMVMFQPLLNRAQARQAVGHYFDSSLNLYSALNCHPIANQTGGVFGTEAPWLEAILFAYGAQHITTVEFRTTLSRIPNLTIMKPLDWAQDWKSGKLPAVDFAFSYSSWEHDGLGRYGDPVDPWGDLKAMQRASCWVKPGGLLYFGAPSSATDQLQYNAHRIYGPVRLPLLTANWEVLGVYQAKYRDGVCGAATCDGLFPHWQKQAPVGDYGFQPVIVLRNLRTSPCHSH